MYRPHGCDGVDVHGPHDALRIGVGAGRQVERLVLGRVDAIKTTSGRTQGSGTEDVGPRFYPGESWLSQPNTPCWRTRSTALSTPSCARAAKFEVVSEHKPAGDQPTAIEELERRIEAGEHDVVLLGATGTGKSATTAWLIERLQRPTLVMAPNKTLAAQLANELREMLPQQRR